MANRSSPKSPPVAVSAVPQKRTKGAGKTAAPLLLAKPKKGTATKNDAQKRVRGSSPAPASVGRPVKEIDFDAILLEFSTTTKSIKTICREHGVDFSTVFRRVSYDVALSNRYAQAREFRCDVIVDEMIELSETAMPSTDFGVDRAAVEQLKARIDVRKWLVVKLFPKRYGDRVQNELSTSDEKPFEIKISTRV